MSYDAIYAATRNAIGNPDVYEAVRSAAANAFDCGHVIARAQEAVGIITSEMTAPHVVMRPRMFIDGNKWCCLYGENLQDGVAGFGDTPYQAANDFDTNWFKQKPAPSPAAGGAA